jgi:septal ring-binding cell division protein DamX
MQMIRAKIETRSLSGYYAAIVLSQGMTTADLLVPCYLEKVTVPVAEVEKAPCIAYRPTVVRRNLLARVQQARQLNQRFPKAEVMGVLAELGAAARTVTAVMNTAPATAAVERSLRRKAQAEKAAETRAAARSIADRVTFRLTDEATIAREARVAAEAARRSVDALNGVALPKPGSKMRLSLDALMSPTGATTAEMHAAIALPEGKKWGSAAQAAREFAAKYGLAVRAEDGRVWLTIPGDETASVA